MYNPHADESPFNSIPPVVVLLAIVIAAVEIVFQAGETGFVGGPQAVGWRIAAFEDYGFLPGVWDYMREVGLYPPEHLMRFVTYAFLHGSFFHAAFAVVIVLAIGKAVGEVFSTAAFLAVFFLSSIFGALVYGTLISANVPLIGAFPGAYGLIGAYSFLLWVSLARVGANAMQAFTLIGVLLLFQLIFGVLFGAGYDWIADVAGFVAGFLLSFLVSPGGWGRVMAKLRRD